MNYLEFTEEQENRIRNKRAFARFFLCCLTVFLVLFMLSCKMPTMSDDADKYEDCELVAVEEKYTSSCTNYSDNTTYPCSKGGAKTYLCDDGIEHTVR